MSNEVLRAEVVIWRNVMRTRVSEELSDRLPLLLMKVDEVIEKMSDRALVRRTRFQRGEIDPIAKQWIGDAYRRLTKEIDESLLASTAELEGGAGEHPWTGAELATFGAAAAFSMAPLAVLPFIGGMVSTTFLSTTVSIWAVPTAIVGAGAVALGFGPTIRGWTRKKLKTGFRDKIRRDLSARVIGDPARPDFGSLKGTLFAQLDGLTSKRLEALE